MSASPASSVAQDSKTRLWLRLTQLYALVLGFNTIPLLPFAAFAAIACWR